MFKSLYYGQSDEVGTSPNPKFESVKSVHGSHTNFTKIIENGPFYMLLHALRVVGSTIANNLNLRL